MKFAAFSGVLIDYSIQEALRLTSELGMDGLEIAVREPHLSPATSAIRIKEIRQVADGLGLEIPVLAGYMGGFSTASDKEAEQAFADFQRVLQAAGELGSSMIRVGPGGPNAFLAQDYHYAKSAYWIDRCAAEAKKQGVKIVLEIHNVSIAETVESSHRLLNLIQNDNVGMIHDAGNMYITDTDYGRDSVLGLGSRMFHVHVKDELRVDEVGAPGTFENITHLGKEKFLQCRLGEGGADHQPLFNTLVEIGYSGWITMECHAPFHPVERLQHDFDVIRSMLAKAGNKGK
jgi:sugar phosphate isomerase/epimerase